MQKQNIFDKFIPFDIAPVKKHIRPGHAGIVDSSVWFINTKLFFKGMDKNNFF